jgi:hypothetical protein
VVFKIYDVAFRTVGVGVGGVDHFPVHSNLLYFLRNQYIINLLYCRTPPTKQNIINPLDKHYADGIIKLKGGDME